MLTAAVMLGAGCAVVTVRAVYQDQHAAGGNTFGTGTYPTYSDSVLADSPLFYHRLSEGSGTTMADSSGNNLTGSYSSTASTTTYYLVPGRYSGDSGSVFSGDGAYVTTQTAAAAPTTFSIELWFRTGTPSTVGGKLIGFGNARVGTSGAPDRHMYVDNGGRVTFGVFYDNAYYWVRSAGAVNNNTWHHAVGTFGSGVLTLYIDGAFQQQTTGVPGTYTYQSGSYIRVGGDGWSCAWPNVPGCPFFPATGYLNGFIDEAAVYAGVLSQTRVSAHYSAGSASAYESAVLADSPYLYWRFSETGPQLADDSSGAGRDGFYYLGPTVLVNQAGALGGSGASSNSAIFAAIGTTSAARNPTGGIRLYVDGALVAEDPAVTTAEATSGYWRIAGDNLNGWPNSPTSHYLAGWIDEVAAYDTQLSASRIEMHCASRNR